MPLPRLLQRRPGNWTPAHLTRADCTILIAATCVISILRAVDYIVGRDSSPRPPSRPPATVLLNQAFPLWAWGGVIVLGVLMLGVGAWYRSHVLVYLGHGSLMGIYTVLFVATLIPILGVPYGDGFRGATALLGPVVIHFLFWLRTGPRPIQVTGSRSSEVVRSPQ